MNCILIIKVKILVWTYKYIKYYNIILINFFYFIYKILIFFKLTSKFPVSFGLNFGPISVPSLKPPIQDDPTVNNFPDNVLFRMENYVLQNDHELKTVKKIFYFFNL